MEPKKISHVLIADEIHPSIFLMLQNIGLTPDYQPLIKRSELKDVLKHYEGLIIRSKTYMDSEMLENAPNLRFIGRSGAGLDMIDEKEATKRNIAIFHAGEGNKVSVSEHVLGMVLNLFNRISLAHYQVKQGIWHREANRGIELQGKTIGIIGYGNNGQETAKRFKAFGCKVLAYDKYKHDFSDKIVKEATMNEIFEEADVISLHIPLTEETNRMVNLDYFNRFHKNIFFVNIARGEIVVQKDLVTALKSGKVLGACLDVLENEKLQQVLENNDKSFQFLANADNVILTPHIAGWTQESYIKLNEVLVEKIGEYLKKV